MLHVRQAGQALPSIARHSALRLCMTLPVLPSRHIYSMQVSRRGEELLKKRCGVDSQRPPGGLGVCVWGVGGARWACA